MSLLYSQIPEEVAHVSHHSQKCRYELLEHQRTGGHGITNFAVNKGEASCGSGGMHDRALKFFADLSAFERIDALRAVPAVQPCMSVILGSFSEGFPDEEAGPLAEPLVPPCIVSMHLETLEERVTRSPPDAATALIQLAGIHVQFLFWGSHGWISCELCSDSHVVQNRSSMTEVRDNEGYGCLQGWRAR